jgi:hypothetical protein
MHGHTDAGASAQLTLPETALAMVFFITVIKYALTTREDVFKMLLQSNTYD